MVAFVIPLQTDCKLISSGCDYSVLQVTGNKPHITCSGQIFIPFLLLFKKEKDRMRLGTELDKLSGYDPVSIYFPL